MNLLIILLIYLLRMRNDGEELISVYKAIFLKNDFWCVVQDQIKTDQGCLQKINIEIECENQSISSFEYHPEACYSLKSTNFGYIVPRWTIGEDINSIIKLFKTDKYLLKLRYFFIDEPLKKYKGEVREIEISRWSVQTSKKIINFRYDLSKDIRIKDINKRFEEIVKMRILKFYEYIKVLDEDKLAKTKNGVHFEIFYFKNYSECLENLKKIIKNLCYFNLLKEASTPGMPMDRTTLKMLEFRKRLWRNFYENLDEFCRLDKNWKLLFKQSCVYLELKILKNDIYLPIGNKYDINYYISKLSNLIYESVEKIRRNYEIAVSEVLSVFSPDMTNLLKCGLAKLQSRTVKDLCRSKFVYKHFLELLGNEVKTLDDYTKIEKIMCDCFNMFVYIFNLYYNFNKASYLSYSCFTPAFVDRYSLMIVDGIKIKFNRIDKFNQIVGMIVGIDGKNKVVVMEKDTDYFIQNSILYCPSEVLDIKNIQEIEVVFDNNNKRFKVNEYLMN